MCKKYFKMNNKIINGFKVVKNENYEVYIYTSCKKINNWQLFLTYKTKEDVKAYFNKQYHEHIENLDMSIEWNNIETEWIKSIICELNK